MTNTTKIFADTITREQIKALRSEANAASDYNMSVICDVALAPHELHDEQTAELHTDFHDDVITRTEARQICADLINAANASDCDGAA